MSNGFPNYLHFVLGGILLAGIVALTIWFIKSKILYRNKTLRIILSLCCGLIVATVNFCVLYGVSKGDMLVFESTSDWILGCILLFIATVLPIVISLIVALKDSFTGWKMILLPWITFALCWIYILVAAVVMIIVRGHLSAENIAAILIALAFMIGLGGGGSTVIILIFKR